MLVAVNRAEYLPSNSRKIAMTKLAVSPNLIFSEIRDADPQQLYVVYVGAAFELAVGFQIQQGENGGIHGLLVLTGPLVFTVHDFIGRGPFDDVTPITAAATASTWEEAKLVISPVEPPDHLLSAAEAGLLRDDSGFHVRVQNKAPNSGQHLYVSLSDLRPTWSANDSEKRAGVNISHPLIVID